MGRAAPAEEPPVSAERHTRARRCTEAGRLTPEESGRLLTAAAAGDRSAWRRLVENYAGLIWATTQGFRLDPGDAHDVSQTTWLRLVENIDRITEPAGVGAWLATTARHECVRVLRQRRRTVLLGGWEEFDDVDAPDEPVDAELLRHEQQDALRSAVDQLSPACQALLGLLLLDPRPTYEEISAALDMPVGSIGPARGRCLRKLRALLD